MAVKLATNGYFYIMHRFDINQENFINDCIEGALNQIVDFDYEIIIGDDCSIDKTSEICKNYAQNYPNIIKYYRRDQNLGLSGNWVATLKNCSGNYVALCEGDDYWTNPNKLQLQVDDICNDDSCMFSLTSINIEVFHISLTKFILYKLLFNIFIRFFSSKSLFHIIF